MARSRNNGGKETAIRLWASQRNRRARKAFARAVWEEVQEYEDGLYDDPYGYDLDSYDPDAHRFEYECGYLGKYGETLPSTFSQNCGDCGRFLPAFLVWDILSDGRPANPRLAVIAHVHHEHRPCPGSPSLAAGFVVQDPDEIVLHNTREVL